MAGSRTHLGRRRAGVLRQPGVRLLDAEHEGRLPQPGVPAGSRNTPSASAGYHADLSIPGYEPKTPTVLPPAGDRATGPAGTYAGAGGEYSRAQRAVRRAAPPLVDVSPQGLLDSLPSLAPMHSSPGTSLSAPGAPSSPLQAALEGIGRDLAHPVDALLDGVHTGGANPVPKPPPVPKSAAPANIGFSGLSDGKRFQGEEHSLLSQIASLRATNHNAINRDSRLGLGLDVRGGPKAILASNPNPGAAVISSQPGRHPAQDPADPLGAKTLGDVTAQQLAAAAHAGTLRKSPKGVLSTPQNRQALQQLRQARQAVAASGPDLQSLHRAYPELSTSVLKSYRDASRRTGVPAPLLAGIENAESTYGSSTLPGVHSGQNFAGAAGPFQIGNGTGASGDAWQGLAEELWGDQAGQHSIYNQHDAALAAGQYLSHTYAHATDDPSTWHAAAESYNHSSAYADDVVATASEHEKLAKLGLPPNPSATEALRVAKRQAREAGVNPVPANGDVTGGGQDFTVVRADAKGMVDWLDSMVGTQEGSARQLRWAGRFGLGSTEPWCANLVSNGLLRRGFSEAELPENPNNTGTPGFEQWGEEGKYAHVVGRSEADLPQAEPGDVLAFSGEHTATYVGNGEMVSGNFSDEVEKTPVSAHPNLSMIIRPDYKGGKVRIPDSQLAGSSVASATAAPGEAVAGAAPAAGGEATAAGAPGGGITAQPEFTPLDLPSFAAGPTLAATDYGTPGPAEEDLLALLTQPRLGRRA